MVLTETWATSALFYRTQGLIVAQSRSFPSAGVAILMTSKFDNVQPVNSANWTQHTITVRARLAGSKAVVFVIAHYSKPGSQAQLDQELRQHVRFVKRRQPDAQIIIAGDLNRTPERASQLADRLSIHLCQGRNQTLITHLNAANPRNSNQLDYILANNPFGQTQVLDEAWQLSDHRLLRTTITIQNAAPSRPRRHTKITHVDRQATREEIKHVLMD